MLNKRKDHAPCERILFDDGEEEDIWCTFSEEQMDLNLSLGSPGSLLRSLFGFLWPIRLP
ncbi:MAG: hypothetical protein ACLRMZ_08075 [Blautia marasmi]